MPSTPGRPQSRLWRALAPAVFGLAGLLFATSFQAARGTDLRSDRGLPGLIDTANRDVAAKSSTIEKLQNELDALTAAAAPSDGRLVPLTGTINLLAPHVGTRAVQGPALTVDHTAAIRLGKQTAKTAVTGFIILPAKEGHLPLQANGRAHHQRHSRGAAAEIDQIAACQVIAAIEHQIHLGQQIGQIALIGKLGNGGE